VSRVKNHKNSGKGGGSGSGKGRKKLGKPRGRKMLGLDGEPIRCLNCGKKGHWAKDCWSKPKKGNAHLAQIEEEEPLLFLVSAAVPIPTELQSGGAGELRRRRPPQE
jgi:hypothetical protein